jgi:hypothetical protein
MKCRGQIIFVWLLLQNNQHLFMRALKINLAIAIFLINFSLANSFAQTSDCEVRIIEFLKSDAHSLSGEQKRKILSCIFQIQNQGFLYDEQECKYDSALIKIETALAAWEHLHDTLSQANLLKYMGYLNGRLGNMALGKQQIAKAISLYKAKSAEFGIAVSLFDLAKVYTFDNKLDSAVHFSKEAKAYWVTQDDPSRLLVVNNHLIYLAGISEIKSTFEALIVENNLLMKNPDLYWQNELDFYFVTMLYFQNANNPTLASEYATKYDQKSGLSDNGTSKERFSLYDSRNCE